MADQLPNIQFIREHLNSNQYRLTKHATIVRLQRNITMNELKIALLSGEIIEKYPNDQPYPSCLVLGWLSSGDPLHIVCSRGNSEPAMRIVTVYEPSDDKWYNDYKTRTVRQ
jgi:hypothetical protein